MHNAARLKAYQELFDAFVEERHLDIEFDNWPEVDERDWDASVSRFNREYPAG